MKKKIMHVILDYCNKLQWLILKKAHTDVKFNQSRWLDTYISNTYYISNAENDFQKDMNNCLVN